MEEKIKLGDDIVRSGQKIKYQKQHDIPDDVVSTGTKNNQDIPEELEEHNFNNVRENLDAHKAVQYILKILLANMMTLLMIVIIIHLLKPVKIVYFEL